MELLVFSIPIITCIVLLTKFRKETTLWEYGIVLIPSIILFFMTKSFIIGVSSLDTEYLGDVVSHATYYEDWDETVMVTKTRRVYAGTDSKGRPKYRTETYTVPERKYHPKQYIVYYEHSNRTEHVSYDKFVKVISVLNTKAEFKDMHRHYRSKDGDAYIYYWDNTENHAYTLTYTHNYTNKVKASKYSIFKYYNNLSKEELENNYIVNYPEIEDLDQNPILGCPVSLKEEKSIRYLNATYGPRFQIRTFIILFPVEDPEVAEMQRSYWEGGNKNEFVVCLGIKGDSIIWSRPFSWADSPNLEVLSRQYFIDNPKLDLVKYSDWLKDTIPNEWQRKEFKDFNYLQIELSPTQYIIILILVLIYNLGISYWVIKNEYTN